MCDLVASVDLRFQIFEVCGPDTKNTRPWGCEVEFIVRSSNQSLDWAFVDLNDLINLPCMVVDEIEEAICCCNKYKIWLFCALTFSLGVLNNCLVKVLTSRSIIQYNWLAWQVPALNFVKFNVLFSTRNDWVRHCIIESYEACLEVRNLTGNYFNLLKFDHVDELIDQNDIPDLMILSSKAQIFCLRSARYAHWVDRLERWLKCEETLAWSIGGVKAI